MKNILIGLLLIGSISAFAQNMSEFERGFNAGVKSCQGHETPSTSTWRCTLHFGGWETSGFGQTQADALNIAIKNCDKYEGKGSAAHNCRANASRPNRCFEI
jgi:hypothetical protein